MTDEPRQHPDKDVLMAFGLGKLGPDEAEQIAQHLDRCRDCSETIVNLEDDTFVALVRNAPASAEPAGSAATLDAAASIAEDTSQTAELPSELLEHPRYEILELIGHGGMGDVYKAQHKVMNRVVALKVIRSELVRNEAAVGRFRREVQAAARLRHHNIVTAFDADQAGNLHFLVMEYIDGVTLDEVVASRGRLSVKDACDYIRQAAEGLQHAHDLGMVHRDIKPHNLMIEQRTGTLIGSAVVVKILDFGLANFANEVAAEELSVADQPAEAQPSGAGMVAQLTQMGAMMGTPDYIAPEQVQDAHAVDIRADIYSLGCTFYTLLTGKVPFGEGSVLEKIKAHTEREAAPLSEHRDDVPVAVEAIVRKMMAKDRAARHQTPAELIEALEQLARDASVPTEKPTPVPAARPARRPVALLTAIVGVLLAMAAGVMIYLATDTGRLEINSERIDIPGAKIVLLKDGQEYATFDVEPTSKLQTIRAGNYEVLLRGAPEGTDLQVWSTRRGKPHDFGAPYSPKGKVIAVYRGGGMHIEIGQSPNAPANVAVEANDAPAALVEEVRLEGLRDFVSGLGFTPNGTHVITGGADGAMVWNARNGRRVRELPRQTGSVHTVAVSSDGQQVVAAGKGDAIVLSDFATGKEIRRFTGHTGFVECVAFSPDGQRIASGSSNWVRKQRGDVTVRMWDVETGREVWKAEVPSAANDLGMVYAVLFTPDGRQLVTVHHGPQDGVSVWDAATGKLLRRFSGSHSSIKCAALSPDGKTLATGHEAVAVRERVWNDPKNAVIRLWDLETGRELGRLAGHTGGIGSLNFSSDGQRLLSCSGGQFLNDAYNPHPSLDNTLRVWDVANRRELIRQSLEKHGQRAVFSPDSRYIASSAGEVGQAPLVQIWRLPERVAPPASQPLKIGMNEDFGMLFEGRLVAPAELSRVLSDALEKDPQRVVAIDLPKRPWAVAGHVDQLEQIARIVGAKHITRPAWSEIRIEFGVINSSVPTLDIKGPGYNATGFANSHLPSVREVIAKNPSLPVFLDAADNIDLTEPNLAQSFAEVRRVAEAAGAAVRISRQLAGRLPSQPEKIMPLQRLEGSTNNIDSLAYSTDGRYLFAGSGEKVVYQWDVAAGKVVRQIPVGDYPRSLAVHPDGVHLFTGHYEGGIKMWSIETGREAGTFKHHEKSVEELAVSADGQQVLSVSIEGLARLWNLPTGTTLHEFSAKYSHAAALANNGKVAAHSEVAQILIWDTQSGAVRHTLQTKGGPAVSELKFSPDGQLLVSGTDTGIVKVWDVESGRELYRFDQHKDRVASIVFTSDGRHFITGSWDRTLRIFDAERGVQTHELQTETWCVSYLAIAPNGRTLATAGGMRVELIDGKANIEKDNDYAVHLWKLPESVWAE